MKQEILQNVVISEWEDASVLEFKVDLIVLIKNKVKIHIGGAAWALDLECLTPNFIFNPLTVTLTFIFTSENSQLIEANRNLQIGNFYKVKGIIYILDDLVNDITLYNPEYEQVEANTLPQEIIKLLIDNLTENDLSFEWYSSGGAYMEHQYKKAELFPWYQ